MQKNGFDLPSCVRSCRSEVLFSTLITQPAKDGTWLGTIHRWWIEHRGSGEYVLLAELEHGEDKIIAEYEKAINACAGTPVSAMLHQLYMQVKDSHDTIRDLRDAYKEMQ